MTFDARKHICIICCDVVVAVLSCSNCHLERAQAKSHSHLGFMPWFAVGLLVVPT